MPSPFCKLADPARYVSCPWNLATDAPARVWWVEFFKRHFVRILELGIDVEVRRGAQPAEVQARADACRRTFHARCDRFLQHPDSCGTVTVVTLDVWRDTCLREFGFHDPFALRKEAENHAMLPLLPEVCRQMDAMTGRDRLQAAVEGVFAGNIFDLGSEQTANSFMGRSPDFFSIRARLKPRPWLIDDLDRLMQRLLEGPPHRKAVFFVDNAGSDFMLGALPMMRWLAQRGTHIVLAANELPTLNDMTIEEARRWWPRICSAEPSLAALPFQLVSTGTAEPLLDLSAVSDELNAASTDADLVILEGMGRAIESNLDAALTCDVLKIGMIKMEFVAERLGGQMYDLVCRFDRPGDPPRRHMR